MKQILHTISCEGIKLHHLLLKKPRTFKFNDGNYNYFFEPYNQTWENERCVELAIVFDWLIGVRSGYLLEVGNVFNHYLPMGHVVVDKYEKQEGVVNQDIMKFKSRRKFHKIFSISTIEHVGFDEKRKDPAKAVAAIWKIRSMLEPDGEALITIPYGYNQKLDEQILNDKTIFSRVYGMKRIGKHEWKQCTLKQLEGVRYGYPYHAANGLVIGYVKKVK